LAVDKGLKFLHLGRKREILRRYDRFQVRGFRESAKGELELEEHLSKKGGKGEAKKFGK